MAFEITVKVKTEKKINNQALAQQLANIIESFTGKRTVVRVAGASGVPSKK